MLVEVHRGKLSKIEAETLVFATYSEKDTLLGHPFVRPY